MKVLISGVCGFAGSHLARYLMESHEGIGIVGVDNLARFGSETNRLELKRLGVNVIHGDIRVPSDLESLPAVDWVIDAAAQPSVLAGRDGKTSSRQLLEHNLLGTINLLEYCRRARRRLDSHQHQPRLFDTCAGAPSVAGGFIGIRARSRKEVAHRRRTSGSDGGVQHRSADLALWSHQARQRTSGSGVCRGISGATLDEQVRGSGGSGAVWHSRAGHFLVLDPCAPRQTAC